MLLTIQNIQKYFGAELCLRNISCVLDVKDRAATEGDTRARKAALPNSSWCEIDKVD